MSWVLSFIICLWWKHLLDFDLFHYSEFSWMKWGSIARMFASWVLLFENGQCLFISETLVRCPISCKYNCHEIKWYKYPQLSKILTRTIFFVCILLIVFCYTGVWTQCLVHARQVLYQLNYTHSHTRDNIEFQWLVQGPWYLNMIIYCERAQKLQVFNCQNIFNWFGRFLEENLI
jgi:hypothetical protein